MNALGPTPDPFRRIWTACLMFFGSVVLLNLSIMYLQPILPWVVGAIVVAAAVWIVVAIVRWRRSRW